MRTLTRRELIGNFFFARGSYYTATGQTAKAIEDYQRVVACNPRDVDGYANLARLCARQARYLGKDIDLARHFPEVFAPTPRPSGARVPFPIPGPRRGQRPRVPDPNALIRPYVPDPQDLIPDPLKNLPGARGQR